MMWKRYLKRWLFPGRWVVFLCTAAAAGGLIYVMENGEETPAAYPIYAFSFYALVILCALLWKDFRHPKQVAETVLDRIPLLRRYVTDVSFGMHLSLYLSLALNFCYAAMKLGFGIFYHSTWFVTLAVYYLLLAVIRLRLAHYAVRHEFGSDLPAEWRQYRFCGGALLLLNLALGCIVTLVVRRNESFRYAGYLIYIMAMYAFYCISMAVRNVVRYRKFHSPLMSAAKALHLATALVSMLALETAMLEQFGSGETPQFRTVMTGCTGGAVCLLVLGMAIYMIASSNREIRKLEKEKTI